MQLSDISQAILRAYRQGVFPMAQSAADENFNFYRPHARGQLPILELHIPKKLIKAVKARPFEVRINTNFEGVMKGCAAPSKGRENTWINAPIREIFMELHEAGHAHSVECWQEGKLVGGLYGLAIGRVFCGESMFSTRTDASKIALVHLCARLHAGGFKILDTQYINDHLQQFAAFEIPQEEYEEMIREEMEKPADFILEGRSENKILENYLTARQNL